MVCGVCGCRSGHILSHVGYDWWKGTWISGTQPLAHVWDSPCPEIPRKDLDKGHSETWKKGAVLDMVCLPTIPATVEAEAGRASSRPAWATTVSSRPA